MVDIRNYCGVLGGVCKGSARAGRRPSSIRSVSVYPQSERSLAVAWQIDPTTNTPGCLYWGHRWWGSSCYESGA